MRGNNRSYIQNILLALAVVFFVAGIARLFLLRFEVGDVYPAYSSLRSDPLGARALYESLVDIPGVTASRNFRPFTRLPMDRDLTLFVLGAKPVTEIPEESMKGLTRIAENGGRIVIAFYPLFPEEYTDQVCDEKSEEESEAVQSEKDGNEAEQSPQSVEESENKDDENVLNRLVSVPEILGVHYAYDNKINKAVRLPGESGIYNNMPDEIPWHTGLYFSELHEEWQVLYTSNDQPVIIERRLNKGSIVFVADSYLFSNEALRNEPHTELLAWLTGKNSEIVFDEAHLGIREQRGIIFLVRKYQLSWFSLGLLITALLVIWKRSVSLVPLQGDEIKEDGYDLSSDQDYLHGLESLLHRYISQRNILDICYKEWEKSGSEVRKRVSGLQMDRIKELLQKIRDQKTDTLNRVQGYNEICKIISRDRP